MWSLPGLMDQDPIRIQSRPTHMSTAQTGDTLEIGPNSAESVMTPDMARAHDSYSHRLIVSGHCYNDRQDFPAQDRGL